ncbi:MAG: oxidative damage protection protein [Gammaproteobacteria bacterium]|jgi:Fe-S cluster biosynthesis and repair protein YggX
MTRMVDCIKLGTQAEGLDFQPWPGDLGARIFDSVSKQAWQEWLRQQTILINEYKLNPLDANHKKYLAEQMEAYFFGDGIVMPDQWKAEND